MHKNRQISFDSGCDNLERLVQLNIFAKSIYEANTLNPGVDIMDITNKEILEFLKGLHSNNVKYMLVGGVATVFHGHIRTTQDLDLWVQDIPENKKLLVKALKQINVPGADNFENVEMVPGRSMVTIGEKGFVADFMGYMKAFKKEDFDKCYDRARKGIFEGVPITVISIDDLIKEKEQPGRAKDIDDVEHLQKLKR